MLFALFATMPAAGAGGSLTPQVNSLAAATLTAGACHVGSTDPAPPAQVRVSWTLTNMDTTVYDTLLYENNILVATPTGSLLWDKTVNGNVEFGDRSPWTASWTYRLDVVRKSDGQVVASRTSATFSKEYGGCTGGAQ